MVVQEDPQRTECYGYESKKKAYIQTFDETGILLVQKSQVSLGNG